MDSMSSTRSVKLLKYIRRMAPKSIAASSLAALEKLPSRGLASLHAQAKWDAITPDPQLRAWLQQRKFPEVSARVSAPLFRGTLVFAQVSFAPPGVTPAGVSAADTQTAITYATLAAGQIQRYASQYGLNSINVWPVAIPYTAVLKSNTFDLSDFEAWVDDIGQFMRHQVANPCIIIMHDRTLPSGITFLNNSNSFHSKTDSGVLYCYSLVFGQSLTVADNNHLVNNQANENVYAHTLSHEIAEMVVDPDGANLEVCDPCSTNCGSVNLFNLFDQQGVFMGGTTDIGSASSLNFGFFVNSIVRADVALASKSATDTTQCVPPGGNVQSACIYPPPLSWSGPGLLSTVGCAVSVAGHFSSGDQRHLVVVGTSAGKVHEIFWKPAQAGIEGEDDLPVTIASGDIVSVSSTYAADQQRHVVVVGTAAGKVHEIFWKPDTVGIEGHDDLPVSFDPLSIVDVAALYDTNQQRYIVIVATSAGKVHEIFWKADTVGIKGHDDLPVSFAADTIVAVTALHDSNLQRYLVVVATSNGKLREGTSKNPRDLRLA